MFKDTVRNFVMNNPLSRIEDGLMEGGRKTSINVKRVCILSLEVVLITTKHHHHKHHQFHFFKNRILPFLSRL